MNTGFMGSNVFGNRIGQPTRIMVRAGGFRAFGTGAYFAAPPEPIMMPEPWQKDTEELGRGRNRILMGQSRTEGVEFNASAEPLCALLKKALAENQKSISGSAWDDFFSAMDRLRPLEKENGKWRAEIYHQMALSCPNEVSRLRSMPGSPVPLDKCVRLIVRKSPNQIISTIVEPYQTRGWSIVEVPISRRGPRPMPAQRAGQPMPMFEEKLIQQTEVWACPPGDSIPKKTSLTAQEAADLARSLGEAIGPIRSAAPEAAACVKDSQADLAVTEKLLDRLGRAADSTEEGIDVTQDEVDAANKIIDCASKLGARVSPIPESLATGGISPLATAGIIGTAGAGIALLAF